MGSNETPWKLGRIREIDTDFEGLPVYERELCDKHNYTIIECDPEIAARIVRAVNNHDSLLAACSAAVNSFECEVPQADPTIALIRAAIAQAEEPTNGK